MSDDQGSGVHPAEPLVHHAGVVLPSLPFGRATDETAPLSLEMVLSLGSTTSSLVPKLVSVKMRRCGLLDRTRDISGGARGRSKAGFGGHPFACPCAEPKSS